MPSTSCGLICAAITMRSWARRSWNRKSFAAGGHSGRRQGCREVPAWFAAGGRDDRAGEEGVRVTTLILTEERCGAAGRGGNLPDFSPCESAAQWFESQPSKALDRLYGPPYPLDSVSEPSDILRVAIRAIQCPQGLMGRNPKIFPPTAFRVAQPYEPLEKALREVQYHRKSNVPRPGRKLLG